MTNLEAETLAVITERPADHEYTSEALPSVINKGAVRSWDVEVGCEATVGEIDPHTAAAFPADPRGERLTLLPGSSGMGRLALILVQDYQANFVTLDEANPTVQTIPGQLIVIPETGDNPTYYLCEYRNEQGQLPMEVSPVFESVRSYLWNLTHHHPKSGRRESTHENFIEVDRRLAGGPRIQFSYKNQLSVELQKPAYLIEPQELGRISITGRVVIDEITSPDEWGWYLFVLKSDGTIASYCNSQEYGLLTENEQAHLYGWLAARHQELWEA